MSWKKIGLLFNNKSISPFLLSHFSNPLAIKIEKNTFRVFYSGRNYDNKSSVGHFDFNISTYTIENYLVNNVDFKFGDTNTFFSHGVSVGCCYKIDLTIYILFMGWNIKNDEHWRGDIGRIEVDNKFNDLSLNPKSFFLGIDNEDPISLSYPFVIFENGLYKMWYGSTVSWNSDNEEMIHVIKYATSLDGFNWNKHGIAIPYEIGVAQAFSRPTVIVNNDGYHMWYSYRSGIKNSKYQIGYSYSLDGVIWERKHNKYVLEKSITGWDSEMVCYPFVFEHENQIYMLYNGNNFGETGIGIAKLDK